MSWQGSNKLKLKGMSLILDECDWDIDQIPDFGVSLNQPHHKSHPDRAEQFQQLAANCAVLEDEAPQDVLWPFGCLIPTSLFVLQFSRSQRLTVLTLLFITFLYTYVHFTHHQAHTLFFNWLNGGLCNGSGIVCILWAMGYIKFPWGDESSTYKPTHLQTYQGHNDRKSQKLFRKPS